MWEYMSKGAEAGKQLKKSFVLWEFETNKPPICKTSEQETESIHLQCRKPGSIRILIQLLARLQIRTSRKMCLDWREHSPYNHGAARNGCKQGEQYAMVGPAGRKEGR